MSEPEPGATPSWSALGDFARKLARGLMNGESAIKPEYESTGIITIESTYKR